MVDQERVARAVREIILAVGEDPDRAGLEDTPSRVAAAYTKIFGGLTAATSKIFAENLDIESNQFIAIRDIPVYSVCEHHLLPFFGKVNVVYSPKKGRIIGFSGLRQIVAIYMRRMQIQERLTQEIAQSLVEQVDPAGVLVNLSCEHLCVSMRFGETAGSSVTTSATLGVFEDPEVYNLGVLLLGDSGKN